MTIAEQTQRITDTIAARTRWEEERNAAVDAAVQALAAIGSADMADQVAVRGIDGYAALELAQANARDTAGEIATRVQAALATAYLAQTEGETAAVDARAPGGCSEPPPQGGPEMTDHATVRRYRCVLCGASLGPYPADDHHPDCTPQPEATVYRIDARHGGLGLTRYAATEDDADWTAYQLERDGFCDIAVTRYPVAPERQR